MQHNSSTLYIKIDEATHGSPLGVLSDPLQPRRCPLDHRLRSPDIRQGGSPGAPRSRPVDEDLSPSLAARPGSQDPACHSGPQNSDSRWSSQYSVSSRLSSPEGQPLGRESPPSSSTSTSSAHQSSLFFCPLRCLLRFSGEVDDEARQDAHGYTQSAFVKVDHAVSRP